MNQTMDDLHYLQQDPIYFIPWTSKLNLIPSLSHFDEMMSYYHDFKTQVVPQFDNFTKQFAFIAEMDVSFIWIALDLQTDLGSFTQHNASFNQTVEMVHDTLLYLHLSKQHHIFEQVLMKLQQANAGGIISHCSRFQVTGHLFGFYVEMERAIWKIKNCGDA